MAIVAVLGALAADAVVGSPRPPSATPLRDGLRVQLSTPGAGDDRWTLDVYRARRPRDAPPALAPGAIEVCLGVSLAKDGGRKRWRGITCALSAAAALRVRRDGLRLDCGAGGGYIAGQPVEASPICGLVAADVNAVTVSDASGRTVAAQLSAPFRLRFNRDASILKRAGVDPARVRRLPRDFRVRALLAFVPTPPTPVGARTPLLTVRAERSNGTTITRRVGGRLVFEPPIPPPLRPTPGAPKARLAVVGADGGRWRSTAWRGVDGGLCATARRAGAPRSFSMGCHGARQVIHNLRTGPQAYTGTPARSRRATYPVYGFVRAEVQALTVISPDGRRWAARLSRVFTTVRRAGRAVRVRAFLAALPGPPPSRGRGLEFEQT